MNDTKAQSLPHAIPVEIAIAALNATAEGLSQMEPTCPSGSLVLIAFRRLPAAVPSFGSWRISTTC